MKRRDLLRHLRQHGCECLREGGNHSWWHHPSLNRSSAVPRHSQINNLLVVKICKDLGVPRPYRLLRSYLVPVRPAVPCGSTRCSSPRHVDGHPRNHRGSEHRARLALLARSMGAKLPESCRPILDASTAGCRRHHVARLHAFGWVLGPDFRPGSALQPRSGAQLLPILSSGD